MNTNNIFRKAHAVAKIKGSPKHPDLNGIAGFSQTKDGVLVSVFVKGLPKADNMCKKPIFAIHIHSGGSCSGNETDYFADALTHYNPDNCSHPYHAGGMPPLFGANGSGFSMFLTDRFLLKQIIGKTVIIHSDPDDFTTQPSGNSGEKIACGVIVKKTPVL